MARKIRAGEVLRLLESGMSRNAIARSQGMSRHGVQAVSEAAEAAGTGWAEAEGMSGAEVYAALFPRRSATGTSTRTPTRESSRCTRSHSGLG